VILRNKNPGGDFQHPPLSTNATRPPWYVALIKVYNTSHEMSISFFREILFFPQKVLIE